MRNALTTILLIAAFVFAMFGCARSWDEPKMFTGQVLTRTDIVIACGVGNGRVHFGKAKYAQVSREWVEWFYGEYRSGLSEGQFGIVRWDGRFTCTSFTTKFVADAQMRFFAQSFQYEIGADTIGLGEFWYDPGADGVGSNHALVIAMTERGREFFEPQTGQWVTLTPDEIRSAFMRKFD